MAPTSLCPTSCCFNGSGTWSLCVFGCLMFIFADGSHASFMRGEKKIWNILWFFFYFLLPDRTCKFMINRSGADDAARRICGLRRSCARQRNMCSQLNLCATKPQHSDWYWMLVWAEKRMDVWKCDYFELNRSVMAAAAPSSSSASASPAERLSWFCGSV